MSKLKYYPNEVNADRYIGIKLPFNKSTKVKSEEDAYNEPSKTSVGLFTSSKTTEEQALSNLKNLLLTRKGERVYLPEYGTPLRDFVFEQNVAENRFNLQEDLREAIALWLPYITFDLEVVAGSYTTPGDPLHGVIIDITFSVVESDANRRIRVFAASSTDIEFEGL